MLIQKRLKKIIRPVVIFIAMQLVWLSLVGMWIQFYISNHIILTHVGDQISTELMPGSYHVLILILGVILLILLQSGFYSIYFYLNRQINVNRLQDQFISNVTHELKSPLASIQLYLETLDSREVQPERLKEFVQLMMKDAKRLSAMIDKILGTISIDQRRLAFNFKVYNMKSIIPIILDEIKLQYETRIIKNIVLENLESCRCVLDRNALKLVFLNLLENAIRYSGENFQFKIRAGMSERYCILEFSDKGIGIPAGEQKRIFRKFYRVYGHNIPNVKGTGLGLFFVKEIIKYHGGRITAESEGKNKGATFRIELPIYKKTKKRYVNRLLKSTIKRKKRSEQEYN